MTTPDTRDWEFGDPEERAQYQLEKLQATVNRAHNTVPFYRDRFLDSKTEPSHVETLEDLRRVPFTERRHLAENYPYGLFAVPLRDIVRIHTAPGTTGTPSVSGYTANDLALWRRVVARALIAARMTDHDILQILLDPGLANWGRDYKDGAETLGASVIPLTSLPLEKQIMILSDYKTSFLVTSVSGAISLVEGLYNSGVQPGQLALKTLILVGEPVSLDTRANLEEKLHINTWVHFGLSEMPGPSMAFECEAHDGLHISEDHFYPEIIDPESGEPVSPGESGELVLTALSAGAFPFLRFRTGDRVRLNTQACSCGRTLCRMEWLPDRTDDTVVIRGVKIHQEQVFSYIERTLGFAPMECRLAAGRRGSSLGLEVWIGVDDHVFSDEVKELEQVRDSVAKVLRHDLGVPVRVRLKEKTVSYPKKEKWIMDPEDYR